MSSEEDFAAKISSEAPWWAKAPVWMAAGILGIPSLIAVGAGYFLASNVTSRLNTIEEMNATELHQISQMQKEQGHRWEYLIRFMQGSVEVQIRACVHAAKTPKERDECIKIGDHGNVPPK